MDKYECVVCDYIYDVEKGDADNGIELRTLFKELPESWDCPICGVGKSGFEKVE